MLKNTRRIVVVLAAICTLTVGTITTVLLAAPPTQANPQQLNGSWALTAVVENEPLIHALITFESRGGFIETAAAPGISNGHGAWERIGNRRFLLTNVYLRLGEEGQFIGTSRVRAILQVNHAGDHGSGDFQTDVFDENGVQIDSFTGSAEADRIEPEPLS